MEEAELDMAATDVEREDLVEASVEGDSSGDDGDRGPQPKRRRLEHGALSIDNPEEAEAAVLDIEVGEVLAEAGVDPRAEAAVQHLAQRVARLLKELPAEEVGRGAAKGFLRDLAIPVMKPFLFRPPVSVQLVGSFALHAATRPSPSLDLAVEMPANCFDSKDQLNHRYHAKRALYLAHLAKELRGLPGVDRITMGTLCNDPRKPVLVLHPPAGASPSGLTIRVIPVLPPSTFPLARLAPHRNNLRSAAAAAPGAQPGSKPRGTREAKAAARKGAVQEAAPAPDAEATLPTPHYNTSVLQDMLLLSQHAACAAAAARVPNFAAAAALLRVWARAQAVDSGAADGFAGFLLTMLLTDLVQKGTAASGMSTINLVRTVLVALSNPRTFSGGLFMQRAPQSGASSSSSSSSSSPPDAKAWRSHFPVVFVEASGWLNLAAHISQAALAQAQQCAKSSLELLNASAPDAFEAVFLARRPLPALCDYWYHVRVPGEAVLGQPQLAGPLAHDQPAWRAVEGRIESVVGQALGTRAKWVRVFRREAAAPGAVKLGAPAPARLHVLVGVRVDPTAALRAVDIGPPAEQAAAARAFRDFWGDRAELRRFQDGAICEAVVWECGPAERHLIPDRIVAYALQRHLPAGSVVLGFAGAVDGALQRSRVVSPDTDVQASRLCEAAIDRLSKQLRGVAGVALRVVSAQPLSPVSRHTAVFPPLPHALAGAPQSALPPRALSARGPPLPRCLEPVELVCQLEGSGKWPEALAPFLKSKAALGVQLAQALAASYGVDAQAGEGGYVDVLAEGFAFRLLLATERDGEMQQKALAMAQQTHMHPTLDLALRAWHQGAVAGVAGANPAFEPAVRLAQRWAAAHLLSPHLCPEAIELLVAHCFVGGGGGAAAAAPGLGAPGSRTLGLLRFLRLLCDHPWRITPLIVDPDREMSAAQREAVARQHAIRRGAGTAPAMFIATPRDPSSHSWTRDRPSTAMLHRIAVLAQRSAEALQTLLERGPTPAAPPPPPPAHLSRKQKLKLEQRRRRQQAAESEGDSEEEREAAEAAAAAGTAAAAEVAMAQLFGGDEAEYDVLIRLRRDALPFADRGALGQPPEGGEATAAAAAVQRLRVERAPVSKLSRSILSGIPQSIVQAHGAAAVRRQLLVGFDPLPLLVERLEERFGALAVFCADYVAGTVVGAKWRAAAFTPAPLRPELAYALRPAERLAGAAAGDTEPDVAAVLSEMAALGAGLVDTVELLRMPPAGTLGARLPRT